ncbi:peptidase M16 [Actinobacillus succinogenes]|uniref:Peptidase M16 domain protein n=1 Tax=Actinobacillus succinogenes (strain ATCC 55618 / DSM 22257 / CCUG 43843 / 130Z) TaxID=339671 RepID=A6VQE5_ACTSZ|nr:insulinase family protein [Actinobacillus succinogenes]ABR75192.1 peptidase M16 domain protein [Actinobacillus succinogenes 130Z]PHI40413.1 peptidase M16 [Actinobacillus succinogenes]
MRLKNPLFSVLFLILSIRVGAEISTPIQGKLDNGLRYTLLPLHEEKGHVEIRMKVNAGAVDQKDHQHGVAHMVEHSVFHQSEKYPDVMAHLHRNNWVRGKNYNAVTTMDSTTYMLTPPVQANLEQGLDALQQMLFRAKLTQKDLDGERKVIMEEWRQGLGVGSAMNQQRSSAIRADSRYVRSPVIGTEQAIAGMPAAELQDFYRTWYVPNNMQLLIMGDFEAERAKSLIKQYFGDEKAKNLPSRDYLEPVLKDRILMSKVQDPRSGVSQVAFVFRVDESRSKGQSERARYERMVDRLALAAVTQRIRNESMVKNNLPKGVESLVVRKSDIGRKTAAVAIFASVDKTSHKAGLERILTEIERLKRYPITADELAKQKETVQAQVDNAKKNKGDRDFQGWLRAMMDSVLQDKPYLPQTEIAALTQPILEKISVADINARIRFWLNAEDRIVQYQPPRNEQLTLTVADVTALQATVSGAEIMPPTPEKEITPMALNSVDTQGTVKKTTVFKAQNVQHWQLSNGDKVVWLKLPLARQRTYFKAVSRAGFKSEGLGEWQSQIAAQLIAQNAPFDWETEQLNRWKELSKVGLSINQTETKLIFDGTADNEHLQDLFRLFYAYETETQVKDGLDEIKEQFARSLDLQNRHSDENVRLKALTKLRYSVESTDALPDHVALTALSEQDLNACWEKMVAVPVTYYIVNNMDETALKKLVTQYLAVPRGKPLKSGRILPTPGKNTVELAQNLDPKAEVTFWMFTPRPWQGKDAVRVALLRSIATNKLKQALRDQALGVYSLRFESMLNPESARIESELKFTTEPSKVRDLLEKARAVLKNLPSAITEEDVTTAKSQFEQREKARRKEVFTWMNRLILSEEQFGHPEYLTEMQGLTQEITLQKIKEMASNIYHENNQKTYILLPKSEK